MPAPSKKFLTLISCLVIINLTGGFTMENQGDTKRGKKEGRSPGYPAIDLETALERAKQIKDAEKRNFAPIEAVMKHWGYISKSGPVLTTWAALIKFGLLEPKGTGTERQGRITDLAWNILIDNREESPDRVKAIQEAALSPTIHQKLWDRYEGNLPSDETFRIHLLRDYKFTEGAVKDFISQFKRTIAFAKLGKSDNLFGQEEDKTAFNEEESMPEGQAVRSIEPKHTTVDMEREGPEAEKRFEVNLSGGQITYFRAPSSLGKADWQKIRGLINLLDPKRSDSGSTATSEADE
jgi:hypothetical protein